MGSAFRKERVSLSSLSTKIACTIFFYIEMSLNLPESAEV